MFGYFKRQSLLLETNRQYYDLLNKRSKTIELLKAEVKSFTEQVQKNEGTIKKLQTESTSFYESMKGRDETIRVLQAENTNFYRKAYNTYERKKEELLDLNRRGKDQPKEHLLILEINTLAGVLNEKSINENNVASTLTCYPNTKY